MGTGDGHADIEALRLTREESRAVLDHRVAQLNDLDDKATWTMRTAVIVLGIIASVVGVAGGTGTTKLTPGASVSFGLGVIGLFLTLFVGAGTYAVSTTTFGVGASYRREVREVGYSEPEWLDVLLDEYDEWIREMERSTEENAQLVFWTQALLAGSLGLLFLSISLLAIGA